MWDITALVIWLSIYQCLIDNQVGFEMNMGSIKQPVKFVNDRRDQTELRT